MQKQNPFMKLTNAQWWGWFAVVAAELLLGWLLMLNPSSALPIKYVVYGLAVSGAIIAGCFLLEWPAKSDEIKITADGIYVTSNISPLTHLNWDEIAEIGLKKDWLHSDRCCAYAIYIAVRPLTELERANCEWSRKFRRTGVCAVAFAKQGMYIDGRPNWDNTFDPWVRQLLQEQTSLLDHAATPGELFRLFHDQVHCVYTNVEDKIVWQVSEDRYDELHTALRRQRSLAQLLLFGMMILGCAALCVVGF